MKSSGLAFLFNTLFLTNSLAALAHEHHEAEHGHRHAESVSLDYCSMPEVRERVFDDDVSPERARLIRQVDKKWLSGDVLHYYFFDQQGDGEKLGGEEQKAVVRQAFEVIRDLHIGLEFKEVSTREEAEIRIAFMAGAGTWSYLGRDIVELDFLGVDDATMNYGWDLTRNPSEIFTAIHEIGHTMGFPHEHQNPNAGIVWNEEAVYARLAGPPNYWSRERTHWNIIRQLDPGEVEGSTFDPDSVMGYSFPAGMILEPAEYRNGLVPTGGLSATDIATIRSLYPPLEPFGSLLPFVPQRLDIESGEQILFSIKPLLTRTVRIQTLGSIDSVMGLYEEQDDGLFHELAFDDDSGLRSNARINWRLVRGRTYHVKIRMVYNGELEEEVTSGSILMW